MQREQAHDFDDCPDANTPFPVRADTPPRDLSPGRLGELPEVGPESHYSMEARLFPIWPLDGHPFEQWREARQCVLQEEEELWEAVRFAETMGDGPFNVDIPGDFE